ncbi:MAG TPA: VWA domain-containing protein, partial [Pirellulales bacterium]|nr:VWA domain-containing protein [Pirellulales bacterium]
MLHALLAQLDTTRTTYDFERWQMLSERWHVLALLAVCAAVFVFVAALYRRDSVELRPGMGFVLLALRVVALTGILAYFLELEKRTERTAIHNSRVLLMVDTSLSMGLQDSEKAPSAPPPKEPSAAKDESPVAKETSPAATAPSRIDEIVAVLDAGGLVRRLREVHDVSILRFDTEVARLAALAKTEPAGKDGKKLPGEPPTDAAADAAKGDTAADKTDWRKALRPQGTETRLGQALRDVIHEERANPVAGIVVFSDGGQNAGIDAQTAILAARDAKIPVYTVGVGSERRPAGVRIADFVAPARAYPGDSFTVTGYVQAQELAGRTVTVELTSKPAGDSAADASRSEASEQIILGGNTETIPVKFTLTPAEAGRRTYRLEVKPPAEDRSAADNVQEVDVEIVDRKTKVLLFASGPTREYIFLRNQLRRDQEMVVDVLLQSGQKGISQDSHEILAAFPSDAKDLFEYDAIVAFDPDWLALDDSQVELLERWVAEKAGGLIVIAGPVEMDRWVNEPRMARVRGLYPVEFSHRLTLMEEGRFGSETAWPLEFTREGAEAEFLWLADNAAASAADWASFAGVYGYYGVHGAKPGAAVYARYSDPESASGGQLPVYLAGHFYGSGRVFYLGSGEMWRLRAQSDAFFEQFYTKVLRHVSQGRLLVGSSRGMLLVDRDRYQLGGTVLVRAQLSDSRFEPLEAAQVPLAIVAPNGTLQTLQLVADPQRKGMFVGQFSALQEGTYRLDLAVPDAGD